ncbi:MAG: SpoIIE family protein phosphatase [Spirochaetales bacterium]|nr:SpoIIE family protein phosphatase [Spirochaetales bacterium]
MKIQKRLLLSILPVVFLSVIAVTVTAVSSSINVIEEQVKNNTNLLSSSYSSQLNAKMEQYHRMAVDLSAAIVTAVNVETVLIDARKRYREIDEILFTSLNGKIKDMAPYKSSLLSWDFSFHSGWQEALKRNKTIISDPIDFLGRSVIYIYSPVSIDYVINKEPEVIGVTVIIIPVKEVFSEYMDIVYGETGSVFISNKEGRFIFNKNESLIMNNRVSQLPATTNLAGIEESMIDLNKGFATYYDKGKKNFISFSPVPLTSWSLAITGAYSEFSAIVSQIILGSIIILIVSLIFSSLLIYLMVHGVVMPITILTDVATRISDGDLTARSNIITNNEVGILSNAFNLMVNRVEDQNRILEKEVEERTSELHAANEELATQNESIEAMNEELKVHNESLDTYSREIEAMYEELQVTNESLDSKNREVEAMNEELNASNRMLAKTRDALWTEMELAQKIQTVLLPEKPAIKGFEIAAFMNTTATVGGDYYDVLNVDGKDWFLIGDVSGHGVSAGLIMMMVQTSIHIALSQNPDLNPADLLTLINRTIHSNISKLGGKRYMTLTVFACLDSNKFSFAGAHLPVIIYRKEENRIEFLETPGTWVGLVDDIENLNKANTFSLNNGDALLLYTDGISEAVCRDGKLFSQEGLAELFFNNIDKSVDNICSVIKSRSKDLVVDDDITVMILKKVEHEV